MSVRPEYMKTHRSIINMIMIAVISVVLVSCSDKTPTGFDPTLADDLQTALNIGRYSQHGIGVSAAVLLTNTGYKLLGRIIENAAGSSVSAAIRDRLLDPLDLDQTFLSQEESLPPNIAHPWYDFDENGAWDDISFSFPRMGYESMTWTSGGMYSTAKDLVLWADALFQGQVLSQGSLDTMLDFNYSISGESSMSGYGLGMTEFSDMVGGDVVVIGHTGSVVGYIAIIAYLPEYGVSIALLENDNIYACHVDIINRLISTVANHMVDN